MSILMYTFVSSSQLEKSFKRMTVWHILFIFQVSSLIQTDIPKEPTQLLWDTDIKQCSFPPQ